MWLSENSSFGLVSVIIPTYNRADLIVETLESVRNQLYRPIELIIVDDGSSDHTIDTVNAWIATLEYDSKFDVRLIQQSNRGAPSARNAGGAISHGEFIQFLDSDDLLLEHKLKDEVALYREDPSIGLVYSPWIVATGNQSRIMTGPDLESDCSVSEVTLRYLCTFSPLYRRDILNLCGPWNENISCSQDRDFCARAVSRLERAKRNPKPSGVYRLHYTPESISSEKDIKRPISRWEANNVMRSLLSSDRSPQRASALQNLASRDVRNAREALYCGAPSIAAKILLSDRHIWISNLRQSARALHVLLKCGFARLSHTAFNRKDNVQ